MDKEPLVSVIMIFLDAEKYIEEAIESIFAQTYLNWELLLCDDGSTDGSTKIALRYAERFPDRVRYLEHEGHENRGMSATRNLGINHAKGEYIGWLDADDVWFPQTLQRQVETIREHPEARMVYGRCQYWYSWTGKNEDYQRDFIEDVGVPPDTLLQPPKLLLHILQDDTYIPAIGVLVRRTVLEEIGGFEESLGDEYEDSTMYVKIGLRWPVFVSGECWYRYRQHEDSCCAQIARLPGRWYSARVAYLIWVSDYLLGQGYDNGEVWQVVQDQIRAGKAGLRRRTVRRAVELTRQMAERTLPECFRNPLAVHWYGRDGTPPPGWVHFGGLRRLTPIGRLFGRNRGQPIDRYYTEQFIAAHASDLRDRVLEVDSPAFTHKFGRDRVTHSNVLCARASNPYFTLIGDVCSGDGIPGDAFDCIILTHVLAFVWDFQAAIAQVTRALKPGGVLLVTLPGSSHISRHEIDSAVEIRRFTSCSVRQLFKEHFDSDHLEIKGYGNVLTAVALLHGLAAEELSPGELDYHDPNYEMIITVRAVKTAVPHTYPSIIST